MRPTCCTVPEVVIIRYAGGPFYNRFVDDDLFGVFRDRVLENPRVEHRLQGNGVFNQIVAIGFGFAGKDCSKSSEPVLVKIVREGRHDGSITFVDSLEASASKLAIGFRVVPPLVRFDNVATLEIVTIHEKLNLIRLPAISRHGLHGDVVGHLKQKIGGPRFGPHSTKLKA